MTFQELNTLMRDKSPAQVLQRISREDESFSKLIDDRNIDDAKVKLVLKIICKALDPSITAQPEAKNAIVHKVLMSSNFREKLENLVPGPSGYDPSFIKSVLQLVKISAEKSPNRATREFAYMDRVLQTIAERFKRNGEIVELFGQVADLMSVPLRQVEREQHEQRMEEILLRDADAVPDLFRGLSIIPTAEDFDARQDVQIRANKVKGNYDNVNDYLDIQVCQRLSRYTGLLLIILLGETSLVMLMS